MKKILWITALGAWLGAAPAAMAQSLPARGTVLNAFATPVGIATPRIPYSRKKHMPAKPASSKGKFFPLYPTPQATPRRQRSFQLNPPKGAVTMPTPHPGFYPILYPKATPAAR